MLKSIFHKSKIYPLLLLIAVFIVWKYRQSEKPKEEISFSGSTMGTVYHIKYIDAEKRFLKKEIDSLLLLFNQSLSTYIADSEISTFNRNSTFKYQSSFLYPVLKRSKEIYKDTEGAFDPTIMPLVNAWGFGPDGGPLPDSTAVDSLLSLVSYDSIFFDSVSVSKPRSAIQLDFSAIAKGYAVDILADFLQAEKIKDMMIEIGGEVFCMGKNEKEKTWVIGISNPLSESEENHKIWKQISLNNRAVATSGNYRNYYKKDGRLYVHTISPFTGYPVTHSLLSASVFAPDCMTADAYATAFMVLGLEEAKEMIETHKNIEGCLVYADKEGQIKTYISDGMKEFVIN